jgi:TolA-binding protein
LADFREQQEYLRVEDGAFTKARMDRALKSKKKRFLSRNRYINITLFFIVFVFAMVTAQVGWILFGQDRDGTPISQSATLDSRYFNALESPAADKLEERISRLTGNMETLSGLLADLESKLIATDQVEKRISSLNENLEKLSSMTTDLESRQIAADRLEERISKITKDLQILSDLAAGVESNQRAALATTSTVVPATQKLVSRTTGLPTVANETPAIETNLAPVAVSPSPKLDTDSPTSKRETSPTLPKERQDSVVSKQRAASVPQNRPWTINLISSPDKAYAVSFSDTAQSRGISTELQEVSVKGTPYWRVQLTGFSTQDEAKTAADSVKDKLGLTDIWIMKR